jgi:hypothetical protein
MSQEKNNSMDTFSQAQIAPEVGAELASILGVTGLDLSVPDVYAKYSEITAYFSRFQDAPAIARMVARHAPLKEKLAKVHEYVSLRQSLDVLREQVKSLPLADTISGDSPEMRSLRSELEAKEYQLVNELSQYER